MAIQLFVLQKTQSGNKVIAEMAPIGGMNRFYDIIDGDTGTDSIVLTDDFRGDAFFLHDHLSDYDASAASVTMDAGGGTGTDRLSNVERILGGAGDDMIDLTSPTYITQNVTIQGDIGNDILWGSDGNDILDGGVGTDILAGSKGSDLFVIRYGEGASSVAKADHVRDFEIGSDKFALAGGITYSDLTVATISSGNDAGKLKVSHTSTQEVYAVIDNLGASDLSSITSSSFEAYANDEAISLSGTTTEDQILTLDTSSIVSKASDADLIIKWQSQDAAGDWTTISGETSSTLTLGQSHVGLAIRAVVSFEDTFGLIRSLTSQTSNSVTNINDAPSGTSTTIGTMDVGQILVVDNSAIADEDGLGSISTIWQKSTDASTWTDISGASGTELTLTTNELGSSIRAKSTYVDGQGTTETIYTSATDLVYGLSGTSIFFPKNDDRSVHNIEIEQEFVRANSFAFDFDFTYDASKVNSFFF